MVCVSKQVDIRFVYCHYFPLSNINRRINIHMLFNHIRNFIRMRGDICDIDQSELELDSECWGQLDNHSFTSNQSFRHISHKFIRDQDALLWWFEFSGSAELGNEYHSDRSSVAGSDCNPGVVYGKCENKLHVQYPSFIRHSDIEHSQDLLSCIIDRWCSNIDKFFDQWRGCIWVFVVVIEQYLHGV